MTKYKLNAGDRFSKEQQVKLYQAIHQAQTEIVMAKFNDFNPNQLGAAGGGFSFLQNIAKSANKIFGLSEKEATTYLEKSNYKDFGVDFNSGEVDTDKIQDWLRGPVPSVSSELPDYLRSAERPHTQMPEDEIPECVGQINNALAELDFLNAM